MKLFVIVLCLFSERFLIHVSSHYRFEWFEIYCQKLKDRLPRMLKKANSWLLLAILVLPIILVVFLTLYLLDSFFFGFVGLLLHVIIFYGCLGSDNPFYPTRAENTDEITRDHVGMYLAQVNDALFSVIFWYILLGPLGILTYRLIALCRKDESVQPQASFILELLNWLPARMTCLLYLFVGHFQHGVRHFRKYFFAKPQKNQAMLAACGLQAVGYNKEEPAPLAQAETLVEHAVVLLLVLLAILTMAAWL